MLAVALTIVKQQFSECTHKKNIYTDIKIKLGIPLLMRTHVQRVGLH